MSTRRHRRHHRTTLLGIVILVTATDVAAVLSQLREAQSLLPPHAQTGLGQHQRPTCVLTCHPLSELFWVHFLEAAVHQALKLGAQHLAFLDASWILLQQAIPMRLLYTGR